MPLTLITLPALSDNYVYLIHNEITGATAVVDVPDEKVVLDYLKQSGWSLSDIILTHHHFDHMQGADALRDATGARITGHRKDDHRLPNLDTAVEDGDVIEICGEPAHVMDVSGHTIGHIAYHFPQSQLAFTGDSLMGLGCGRLFEGSPEQMWDSLSKLAALPEDTVICSGHEYSAANADFALSVDSENEALKKRAAEIRAKRAENTPTIPVRLAEELCTNPFLRASDPTLKAALDLSESPDWQVFAEIRRRKDSF